MHVVSRLDRTHIALIEAIVRLPWMTMDSSFVKTYTSFIEILVSARPEYLSLVLGRIALGFTYRARCVSFTLTRLVLMGFKKNRIGTSGVGSWSCGVLAGATHAS